MDSQKFHIHLVGGSATLLGGAAESRANELDNEEVQEKTELEGASNDLRRLANVFAHLTLRCGFPDVVVSASTISDGRKAMISEALQSTATPNTVGSVIASIAADGGATGISAVPDADVLSTELGRLSGSAMNHSNAHEAAVLLEAAVQLLTGEMSHEQVNRLLEEDSGASVLNDVSPYPFFRCRFDMVERALRTQRIAAMERSATRPVSSPRVPYFDFIIATDVEAFDFMIDYFNAAACAATTSLLASTIVGTCSGATAAPLGIFCILDEDANRLCSLTQRLVELLTHSQATSTNAAVAGAAQDAPKEEPVGGMGGYLDDQDDDEWGDEADLERAAVHDAASPSHDSAEANTRDAADAHLNGRSELEQLLERGRWVDEVDAIVLQFQQLLGVDVLSYIV